MTQPQIILAALVAGQSILCLAVGYVIGSDRTFKSLDFGSEPLSSILSTLKPHFGRPHWRR